MYEETTAKVVQVEKKEVPEEAPLLYDLTALQRSANTKLGLTAEQTLNIAQKLYEGGYISYPVPDVAISQKTSSNKSLPSSACLSNIPFSHGMRKTSVTSL